MARKSTKKVDTKKVAKKELHEFLINQLEGSYEYSGTDEYDFKEFSIVVKGINGHDVCISLTTPKAGEDTYDYKRVDAAEEEEEDE